MSAESGGLPELIFKTTMATMNGIRGKIHGVAGNELTVPQFRALLFLESHEGASLSDLSNNNGLTLATASKLVDILASRGLVKRVEHPSDRRRVRLAATEAGLRLLNEIRGSVLEFISDRLSGLGEEEKRKLQEALPALFEAFSGDSGGR